MTDRNIIDKDLDTLIEETRENDPELADAMQAVVDHTRPTEDGGYQVDAYLFSLPFEDREERHRFIRTAAFGGALEREYPAPEDYGE